MPALRAQDMSGMWSNAAGSDASLGKPDTQWFQDAKFGLFIHWGLYSHLGNEWRGKSYYGSGEWLMNRAKIPAADYAAVAGEFNPAGFDAGEWARVARDAGMRYMVVTSKHHEGFAMFASKASPFNIAGATPYARDPMLPLSQACAREGIKFGFYYSQFQDWHEPDAGGNRWDFDESKKDYKKYYAQKSIPQIKELLTGYGPLGLMWFDTPGGLTRDETVAFMREVRALQPQCLISSRVGRGLGDFRDFGDSELPPAPIDGPWEALFTHNDSWGFVRSDQNFKTPRDIIRLLASTAARGGNLLLNVGPDGAGRFPQKSTDFLRETGRWLARNGDAIYGASASPIPDQPWGVMTLKAAARPRDTARLFLHIFERPRDGVIVVPGMSGAHVVSAAFLNGKKLPHRADAGELRVTLPDNLPDERDTVVEVRLKNAPAAQWGKLPARISRQHDTFTLDAALAAPAGKAGLKSITNSRYFGNWKHDLCITGLRAPGDRAAFAVRIAEPGDYRVTLEYYCGPETKGREGIFRAGDFEIPFETLLTGVYEKHQPLPLVRHVLGIVTIKDAAPAEFSIAPKTTAKDDRDLLWLRRVIVEPVR
jgi:alpha-L-fucosidase